MGLEGCSLSARDVENLLRVLFDSTLFPSLEGLELFGCIGFAWSDLDGIDGWLYIVPKRYCLSRLNVQ